MATPAELAAYRSSQRDVVELAREALTQWWAGRDASDPRAVSAALQEFLPELVASYGDVAATVAADWYEELRDQARVLGRYRAVLADPLPDEQVRAAARWAVGPLFDEVPNAGKALDLLTGTVQRLVQQGGRSTIHRNVKADPSGVRWARVPTGAETCAWCRMMASRGAVYLSRKSAGGENNWHNDCDCQPTPLWPEQAAPYDVDRLYQQYSDAAAKAGGNPKAITAQLRVDLGIN